MESYLVFIENKKFLTLGNIIVIKAFMLEAAFPFIHTEPTYECKSDMKCDYSSYCIKPIWPSAYYSRRPTRTWVEYTI